MSPEKFSREDREHMMSQIDTMEVINLSARISKISDEMARLNAAATNQDLPDIERDEDHQRLVELGTQLSDLNKQRTRAGAH